MIEIKNSLGEWVSAPTPSSLVFGFQDITDAKRVASGNMVIDMINRKQKLELEWVYLTKEELSDLLTLIDPITFEVRYIDPHTNSLTEKTFYKGDRSVPVLRYAYNKTTDEYYPLYTEVTVNFIEI